MKEEEYIDHYRQNPNEKAITDFRKLNETRIQKMVEATAMGKGKTVKLTFEIPVEHVTLAAWLAMRRLQYQDGNNIPVDLSDVIEDPLNSHDLKSAGAWISTLIDEQMMFDGYHELCTNYHRYLYHRPPEKKHLKTEGDDDLPDIPF